MEPFEGASTGTRRRLVSASWMTVWRPPSDLAIDMAEANTEAPTLSVTQRRQASPTLRTGPCCSSRLPREPAVAKVRVRSLRPNPRLVVQTRRRCTCTGAPVGGLTRRRGVFGPFSRVAPTRLHFRSSSEFQAEFLAENGHDSKCRANLSICSGVPSTTILVPPFSLVAGGGLVMTPSGRSKLITVSPVTSPMRL